MADYTEALKIFPSLHMSKTDVLAGLYASRADCFLARGDTDQALTGYSDSIKAFPIPVVITARGELYYRKKDYDAALSDYAEAIRTVPNFARAINDRAVIYSDAHQYDRALEESGAAIKADQTFAPGWNTRCWAGALAGKLEDALKDCNQALQLVPDYVYALDSRGLVNLKMAALTPQSLTSTRRSG